MMRAPPRTRPAGPDICRPAGQAVCRPAGQAGFTLIELLVGLFLFGVMAAAGIVLMGSAVQAAGTGRSLLDDAQAAIRLRALISADCAQAAPRPWRDGEGRPHPAFSANDGALFTLVRRGWRNPDGAARPSLQRVTWLIDDGRLIRRTAPMLDGAAPPTDTVLAAGITSARLRIHTGAAGGAAGGGPGSEPGGAAGVGAETGWQDNWAGGAAALPRAIELTLAGPQLGQMRHVLLLGPDGAAGAGA